MKWEKQNLPNHSDKFWAYVLTKIRENISISRDIELSDASGNIYLLFLILILLIFYNLVIAVGAWGIVAYKGQFLIWAGYQNWVTCKFT